MIGLNKAKKRLVLNAATNIANVGVTSLILLWLTPFLVRQLGVERYGMYPLIANIVVYLMILSGNYTTAFSRFISLAVEKKDMTSGRTYFTTAVFSLFALNMVILVAVVILSMFLQHVINIPCGAETDTALFLLLMMASGLMDTFASPLWVSTFVTHKLYLQNASVIAGRLLQLVIIVIGFYFFQASLTIVGVGRLTMFCFQFAMALIFTRLFLPDLTLKTDSFSWPALREMGKMSSWITIDTIGTLFYLESDLIIINLITNAEMVGLYAIVVQWVIFLRTLTPAISKSFSPIVISLIAENKISELTFYAKRAVKFMGIILALPIGLLTGLSTPLLTVWLGPSFTQLGPLMKLLIFPQIIFLAVNPLYFINRGMNKVKMPALVTFGGGILNVIVSMVMLKYSLWGLYAVAGATVLAFMLRSIGFTPVYTATMLKEKWHHFLPGLLPGLFLALAVSLLSFGVASRYDLPSYGHLITVGSIAGLIYCPFCFFLVLNQNERQFIISLLGKKFTKAD